MSFYKIPQNYAPGFVPQRYTFINDAAAATLTARLTDTRTAESVAELVLRDHYADHHRYTQQEIIDFVNQAKAAGAEFIVTTEKDAVRIPKLDRCDVPLYYLRIQIDILSGRESFDQCISRICFM